MLAGVRAPAADRGGEGARVRFDGADLLALPRRQRARVLALVEQDATTDLPLSVLDAVLLGRIPHRSLLAGDSATDRDLARAALARVGMAGFADRAVATLAGGVRQRVRRARALALTILGTVALGCVPAVTTNAWVIGAVSAVGGAGIAVWNVVTLSLRQRITPDALLGRLNSCYRLLAWGTLPLGAAVGGLLGELFGLRTVFVVMAAVSGATLLGMLVVDARAMDAAAAAPDARDTDARLADAARPGAEAEPQPES